MFNTGNCSVPLVASIDGNGNNGNGFGGDGWGWIWIILIFAIFGGWGNGFGFGGNGGANSPGLQGLATRADINEGFALNNLQSGITAIQQGICDSTYATNNAINGVNMGMMQGFNGVERGFCNMSAQLAQCCVVPLVGTWIEINKLVTGKQNPVGVLGVLNRHYAWNLPGVSKERTSERSLTASELPKLGEIKQIGSEKD